MPLTQSWKSTRGVYLLGLILVGLGAWLMIRCGLLAAGLFLAREAVPGAQAALLWRGFGGAMLILLGFIALTATSAYPMGMAVSFDQAETGRLDADDDARFESGRPTGDVRDDSRQSVAYGPPRPHIVVRCVRCGTLNEQSERACVHCNSPT